MPEFLSEMCYEEGVQYAVEAPRRGSLPRPESPVWRGVLDESEWVQFFIFLTTWLVQSGEEILFLKLPLVYFSSCSTGKIRIPHLGTDCFKSLHSPQTHTDQKSTLVWLLVM